MAQTATGKKIEGYLFARKHNNLETALAEIFTAMDRTAKKRYPGLKVGARIKKFIADQEALIWAIASDGRIVISGINYDGTTFPETIYKFARNAIVHDGELDPRLTFNTSGTISFPDQWNLPVSFIDALSIAIISAQENSNEEVTPTYSAAKITVAGQKYPINDLWGKENEIRHAYNIK